MSETSCGVVRDLIPLALDGAVSQESAALVRAHVAACPECRKEYERMKTEIAAPAPKSDVTDGFRKSARVLHLKIRLRRAVVILCVLAVLVCLVPLGINWLSEYVPVPHDQAIASLVEYDGAVFIRYAMNDPQAGVWKSYGSTGYDTRDENVTITLDATRPRAYFLHQPVGKGEFYMSFGLYLVDGRLCVQSDTEDAVDFVRTRDQLIQTETYTFSYQPISELRLGTEDDYVVFYSAGDEIPHADDETAAALSQDCLFAFDTKEARE